MNSQPSEPSQKLRILVLVNTFPVISETFILDHITALMDGGCDVEILARWREQVYPLQPVVNEYRLLERTTYLSDIEHSIPENKLRRMAAALKTIGRQAAKNPSAVAKSLNVFSAGLQALTLRPLLRSDFFLNKRRFDIIHCHFGPNGILADELKRFGAFSGKILTSFHGYDLTRFVRQNGSRAYDDLFSHGDLFLPVNQRFKDELMRLGCSESKVLVHYLGIDSQKFTYTARSSPKPSERLKAISVGRLVEKKGFRFSIEAVAKIAASRPEILYSIVGDGPQRESLHNRIADLGLKEKVRILGWKSREEVVTLMAEADLFLAPSVKSSDGDQEGIPVVLMEAMAIGVPVISTFHGGIPELVENGRSGYLVPERNVDALAVAIDRAMCRPQERDRFTRAARARVEKDFDARHQNKRLLDVYRKLTDGR